jgi:metal-sulfur cluster biosynthetic enzyme
MTDTTTDPANEAASAPTPPNVADIEEALRDVVDPELGINVIEDQVAQALEGTVISHRINWVWMPPWGPDKITDDGREQLRALGFNV